MTAPFVLDRTSILERLGGDEDIYAMMVGMYLDDVETNCAALAVAIASGDAPTVQREAHTVKGLLASFSDEAGTGIAQAIEHRARDGVLAGLEGPVGELQQRLREVASVLRSR